MRAAISRQAGRASAPSRSMCSGSGRSWPPCCASKRHRVDRVADAEDVGGGERAGRRGEAALERGAGRRREAPQDALHEHEGHRDGEQHERQGERAVAQPVRDEAGLVALDAALAGVQELQPPAAAVGERDGQRRGAGQVAVERPRGPGDADLGHGRRSVGGEAGHLVAVVGRGLVGGGRATGDRPSGRSRSAACGRGRRTRARGGRRCAGRRSQARVDAPRRAAACRRATVACVTRVAARLAVLGGGHERELPRASTAATRSGPLRRVMEA